MSIQKSEALVLKKRDFRETSLIVEFYTRDFGKINGLLKGFRGKPPKFASALEPFSYNEIIFYKSNFTSLHLVSQCDIRENFSPLRQNIAKCAVASFMMELLAALMPSEDTNTQAFDLALECLKELKNTDAEKIATIFKIKMLAISGFKPHLDSCLSCGNKVLGQSKFSLALGGLLCEGCFRKDPSARLIFRGSIASILHIEKNDFRNNLNLGMNPQIKKELDLVLNTFLNFHLEKELNSQRVLEELSRIK
ncbi:MAG: DNA repair protein RecO [Candidatus Omnitrophota bacterium]